MKTWPLCGVKYTEGWAKVGNDTAATSYRILKLTKFYVRVLKGGSPAWWSRVQERAVVLSLSHRLNLIRDSVSKIGAMVIPLIAGNAQNLIHVRQPGKFVTASTSVISRCSKIHGMIWHSMVTRYDVVTTTIRPRFDGRSTEVIKVTVT